MDGLLPRLMLLERTLVRGIADPWRDAVRVPKDPDRHVPAIYTALLMARFTWLHELEMAGFAGGEQTAFGPRWLVQRALEFDADSTALLMCAEIQLNGQENIDGIVALPLDLRLRLVQFAAYGFASLLEALQSHLSLKA